MACDCVGLVALSCGVQQYASAIAPAPSLSRLISTTLGALRTKNEKRLCDYRVKRGAFESVFSRELAGFEDGLPGLDVYRQG
jgi:hypothetical protein